MAKVVSHLHSSMRGSIAGITYLTTPSGAIIARQRVYPVNPSSKAQGEVRTCLSLAAMRWHLMPQAARDQWRAAVGGEYGDPESTGRAAFINAFSRLRRLIDVFGVVDCPDSNLPWEIPGVPVLAIWEKPYAGIVGTTGITFMLDNQGPATMFGTFVISYSQRLTRNYFSGPYDPGSIQTFIVEAMGTTTITIPGLIDGAKYFARASAIVSDGSEASPTGIRGARAVTCFSVAVTKEALLAAQSKKAKAQPVAVDKLV